MPTLLSLFCARPPLPQAESERFLRWAAQAPWERA